MLTSFNARITRPMPSCLGRRGVRDQTCGMNSRCESVKMVVVCKWVKGRGEKVAFKVFGNFRTWYMLEPTQRMGTSTILAASFIRVMAMEHLCTRTRGQHARIQGKDELRHNRSGRTTVPEAL